MNRIKELRTKKGLLQKELAAIVGRSVSAISQWESGKYEVDNDSLFVMANFFNVSVDYLLGRSESPVPETQAQNNTELAVLFNKLRKGPLAVEVVKFFLNLSPEKKEAAKTVLFTAFGE